MRGRKTSKISTPWYKRIITRLSKTNTIDDLIKITTSLEKRHIIDNESKEMLLGVLNISTRQVRDIMVSRSQMVTVSSDMEATEIIKIVITSSHTRVPVLNSEKDDIIGILHAKDILKLVDNHNKNSSMIINISDVIKPAVFVPESKRLDSLLKEFKSGKKHIAIVVDEYGSISGMITIEDILEEIVGDIEDEFDQDAKYIQQVSKNEYHVKAITEIDTFNNYFESHIENDESDTIGGYLLQSLEHLPKKGETIILGNFIFTVLKSNNRKIEMILVKKNE